MVDGQGNLHPDDVAHFGDILFQEVQPLVAEMQPGERMHDVLRVINGVAVAALSQRSGPHVTGVLAERLQRAGGGHHRPRNMGDLHQPKVHFQECEAKIHPRFQTLAGFGAAGPFGVGIAVDPHLVAELAAQHLIDRHAVSLARQIPQRHLNPRHAATLPPMAAKLLDAAEQPVDVTGVFAQQPAFQHQRKGGACAVAHLSQPDQTLIGVDFQQG